jgi:multiple sugar transport system permease protein
LGLCLCPHAGHWLDIIGTLQLFNEPQIFSQISNYVSTSFTPVYYAYNMAFTYNNYYYAAALSVVLALVTFVLSFGFLRVTRRQCRMNISIL